jgi:hypothetical protein
MSEEEFDAYPFLIFDEPEAITYRGDVVRFRVGIFSPHQDDDFLGYLPLPWKYYGAWRDLCYQIVYQRNAYLTLRTALLTTPDGDTSGALTENYDSTSARLKYLLYARGMIIEEILSTKGKTQPTLPTFNEFIIKERFDYCWLPEAELRKQAHIFADPFDPEMAELMGMLPYHFPFFC